MWYPRQVVLLSSAVDGGGGLVALCRFVVRLIYVVLEYPGVCCGIVGVCRWCLDVRVPRSSVAFRNEQILDCVCSH